MTKKILITGGFGFIGFNLLKTVIEKTDWSVFVLDSMNAKSAKYNYKNFNNMSLYSKKRIKLLKQDITKTDLRLPSDIDCIIHLAADLNQSRAIKNPYKMFKTNVWGTLKILEYAKNNRTPLIFSSSIKVYSDWLNSLEIKSYYKKYAWVKVRGIDENFSLDNNIGSRGIYGLTKYIGELMCQEYNKLYQVPVIINRKSSIYGYYQYGTSSYGWLWHFIENVIKNKEVVIYGDGKQVRDILFIDDLVNLYLKQINYLLNIKRPVFEVYNVGGGYKNSISLLESIEIIKKLSKKNIKIVFKPPRPSDLKIFITNIRKVSKKFKWYPKIDKEKGIKITYRHIYDIIKKGRDYC